MPTPKEDECESDEDDRFAFKARIIEEYDSDVDIDSYHSATEMKECKIETSKIVSVDCRPRLLNSGGRSISQTRTAKIITEDMIGNSTSVIEDDNLPPCTSPSLPLHFRIKSVTIYCMDDLTDFKLNDGGPISRANTTGNLNSNGSSNIVVDDNNTYANDDNHDYFESMSMAESEQKLIDIANSERVRQLIRHELITTEISYIKGLKTLLFEFIEHIFNEKLMNVKYKTKIISNLPQILLFHEQLLVELQTQSSVAKVFNAQADYFKMYVEYIKEYQSVMDIFASEKNNSQLNEYLRLKRKEKKPLINYLILPIQRLPRYILLLQDLKRKTPSSHREYDEIVSALHKIHSTTQFINEREREIENMSQCMFSFICIYHYLCFIYIGFQIMSSLRNLKIENFVQAHRKFLNQFVFRKIINKRKMRIRQFFVFSDLVIVANMKWKVKEVLYIRTLDVKRTKMDHRFMIYCSDQKKPALYETDESKVNDIRKFEKLVSDSRMQVWDSELSRNATTGKERNQLKTQGVSQASHYRNQLSMAKQMAAKSDQSQINLFLKSQNNKGNKNKVLEMLGH